MGTSMTSQAPGTAALFSGAGGPRVIHSPRAARLVDLTGSHGRSCRAAPRARRTRRIVEISGSAHPALTRPVLRPGSFFRHPRRDSAPAARQGTPRRAGNRLSTRDLSRKPAISRHQSQCGACSGRARHAKALQPAGHRYPDLDRPAVWHHCRRRPLSRHRRRGTRRARSSSIGCGCGSSACGSDNRR